MKDGAGEMTPVQGLGVRLKAPKGTAWVGGALSAVSAGTAGW